MLKKIFIQNKDIVSRKIIDETMLVPIRGKLADMQRIYSLDPVAEYTWEQLDGKRKMEDIISGILENFDVKEEKACADISEFLQDLLSEGLIKEVK